MARPSQSFELAPYLLGRRESRGARRAQGVILTWDSVTGENTISFRGEEYINMPFLTIGNAIPDYTGGNIVVIEGWAPEGRLASWYIVGRVIVPPEEPPDE